MSPSLKGPSQMKYFWEHNGTSDSLVLRCFQKRKFVRVGLEDDWNLFWGSGSTVRSLFAAGIRLSGNQLMNHFPDHLELTRKDLLIKNVKRHQRKNPQDPELIPTSFVLPVEYHILVEEFRRNASSTWIAKPAGKSQGVGIFLVDKLAQLKSQCALASGSREYFVVSRYIEKPLLVGGRKFDLRLYVVVTSFSPLKAYMYQGGFCRFCQLRYSRETRNPLVHLTNVSLQKQGADYNGRHGGKWSLRSLQLYLEGSSSLDARGLGERVYRLVRSSLDAVAASMKSEPHCFECYGYDILVDETLRPWLVEVNASPSLSGTTEADRQFKSRLLDDLLDLLLEHPTGCHAFRQL